MKRFYPLRPWKRKPMPRQKVFEGDIEHELSYYVENTISVIETFCKAIQIVTGSLARINGVDILARSSRLGTTPYEALDYFNRRLLADAKTNGWGVEIIKCWEGDNIIRLTKKGRGLYTPEKAKT